MQVRGKHIVSFCLLGLYLIALLKPIYPVLEYQLNKATIAKEKCINQTILCSGKCYLNEQIQNSTENQHKDGVQLNLSDYPISLVEEEEWTLKTPELTLSSAKKVKKLHPVLPFNKLLKPPRTFS